MSRWRKYVPTLNAKPSLSEGLTLEQWRAWQATADRPLTEGVMRQRAVPTVIPGKGTFAQTPSRIPNS